MINSYSVATAAAEAHHFNYNNSSNNNSNNNVNSGLKTTTANEHKSHKQNIINSTAPKTTTVNMLKIIKSEAESKHYLPGKWTMPGVPTYTKELEHLSQLSNNEHQLQSAIATTQSAFFEVITTTTPQRTEDQENAFRRIEDVHNYAKLQPHHHSQQQRHRHYIGNHHHHSSSDEEDDDDEGDDDDAEDDDEEEEERDLQLKLKQKQQHQRQQQKINDDEDEEQVEVDVVTVTPTTATATLTPQQDLDQEQLMMRPEHHARRPMNAFLIFCKRHRAIVKERYKSLENRAITKILGDWWAALDDQEKQCFTHLAQQNKDAFFNANPNFKWYKLPAPPLRTLATRPSNATTTTTATHQGEEQQQQQPKQHWQQSNEMAHVLRRNYFKFADETQMGELSVLLNVQDKDKDYALQQALSETSQFFNVHMPTKNNNNTNKRGAESASNSSEEEERGIVSPCKKLKTSRSCKGKIYQELINSGQLAALAKSKSKYRLISGSSSSNGSSNSSSNTPPISPTSATVVVCQQQQQQQHELTTTAANTIRAVAGVGDEFDLEEKIKELPALSLDAYLQRKRSTKKKKKFSSTKKQRNSNSSSCSSTTPTTTGVAAAKQTRNKSESDITTSTPSSASAASSTSAVGSQKRKARKESITRRDVSAIEQEVASLLPLTINGCYYFNQAPRPVAAAATAETTAAASGAATATTAAAVKLVAYDVTSTTSDLLILAEVAANRTELGSNSN